ncbi:hypothetical protein ASPCADRAFT_164782 [Aspergillus carbonarius ITEM 5010]|uniref:Zn(2)-C6 fungal-type domain-containing protein n=1 Tax=Aspergillus carbonarius (strain ITEM 5010) TaxID=602072 RepID=A0A1R3RUX2_ASPC5|nr:hypothetical protein ASPCADRAFT_164782 [Aspergillus carbonarius ITEM 5010]
MTETSQPFVYSDMQLAMDAPRHPPRKRTRTGCVNCSRRRRKCDEVKPTCTGCKRRGDKCQWRMVGSFREANIKILNVAPSQPSRRARKESDSVDERVPSPSPSHEQNEVQAPSNPEEGSETAPDPYSQAAFSPCVHGLSPLSHDSLQPAAVDLQQSPQHPDKLAHIFPDDAPQPYIHSSPEFIVDELIALRNLAGNPVHFSGPEAYQAVTSPLFDHSVFSDPADLINDVFVPGSAYEALHTALRNRQLWTARTEIPSRGSTPASVGREGIVPVEDSHVSIDRRVQSGTRREFELSPERENILWQNYLNEICSWLDMFDNHRHFASTFPQMAKSAPHLRYSILALSARQMERQQNAKSQSESLSLYQEAIHLLLPELASKTTPVIASCVILCVLEMLSCNPKEWRRHLDGCAYLIQAAEINGFSGKEEQALFWCFARMDVCGGLISEEETIIPIHNWIPRDMSPTEASQLFLASNVYTFDTYANYTVFLCAQTLGVLFGSAIPAACVSCRYLSSPGEGDSFRQSAVPRVRTASAATEAKDGFAAAPAEIGFMARTADMRDFCVQRTSPLWLAGKVMSHHSEHAAIIETLSRIERETGWATAWRVEDLKEFWGDEDEADEMQENMRVDMATDMNLRTPPSIRGSIHSNS